MDNNINLDKLKEEITNKLNNGEIPDFSVLIQVIDSYSISLEDKSKLFETLRPVFANTFKKENKVNEISQDNQIDKQTENKIQDTSIQSNNLVNDNEAREETVVRTRKSKDNHGLTYYKFFVIFMLEAIFVLGVITYLIIK